ITTHGAGRRQVLEAAGRLYLEGVALDWARVMPGRRVALPTYPFQRKRYWLGSGIGVAPRRGDGSPLERTGHPLLGSVLAVGEGEKVFEARLGVGSTPYLGEHRVFG